MNSQGRVQTRPQTQGFFIPSHTDQRNIAGHIDAGRAGHLTRSWRQPVAYPPGAIMRLHMTVKDFLVFVKACMQPVGCFYSPGVLAEICQLPDACADAVQMEISTASGSDIPDKGGDLLHQPPAARMERIILEP